MLRLHRRPLRNKMIPTGYNVHLSQERDKAFINSFLRLRRGLHCFIEYDIET